MLQQFLLCVVICVVALATFACSRADTSEESAVDPGAATVGFEHDEGMSPEDQMIIEEAIGSSRQFYAGELGRDLKFNITVKVTTIDGGNLGGFSAGRTAWILAGGEWWPEGSGRFATISKSRLAAHELFHNFQSDLIYTDDAIPSSSPWWLVEGSAEYASAVFIAREYGVSWSYIKADYFFSLEPGLPRLDVTARPVEHFGALYTKAFLAMDQLMTGRPMSTVGDYFEATGRMEWDEAFLQVFGIDPAAFVNEFEAQYQALLTQP